MSNRGTNNLIMKKIFILLVLAFSTVCVFSQQYTPVSEKSTVKFTLKNFGFNTGGGFSGLEGTIIFDPANLSSDKFDVSLKSASVNTDNESRDNHLKNEDYFDVKNYPHIHFVSTKVTSGKEGSYMVTGSLTIKKTTKEISFPFTATVTGEEILFKGEFKLNRKDYGIGGSSTLSDNVNLFLSVTARKTNK